MKMMFYNIYIKKKLRYIIINDYNNDYDRKKYYMVYLIVS